MLLLLACAHQSDLGSPVERPGTDADVIGTAELDGRLFLVGTRPALPSGAWAHDGEFPAGWWAETTEADPGLPVGGAWNLGGSRCEVVGYRAVVVEYTEAEPGEAPACGSPSLWAELRCEGEPEVDLAVPYGVAAPVVATPTGVVDEVSFPELLLGIPAWVGAVADAEADAGARGLTLGREVLSQRYQLSDSEVVVIDASVWSGEGQDYCGGEDVFRRLLVVTTGDAEPRVLSVVERDDRSTVEGVVDADGDGVPSLQITGMGEELLGDRVIRVVASCVCGC